MGDEHPPAVGQQRQTVVIRPVAVGDDSTAVARRRAPSLPRPSHALVAALTLAVVVAGGVIVSSTRSSLDVEGIVDGQRLTRRDLSSLTLRITSAGAGADDVRVEVNGDVVALTEDGDALVVGAEALGEVIVDGTNELVVSQPGRFGLGGATVERTFTFDPIGPEVVVPAAVLAPTQQRPTVLRGLVDGAVALTANGQTVTIEPGGAFTVPVAPGTTSVALVATDADGNAAETTVLVATEPPLADHPATVAVHVGRRQLGRPSGSRADSRVGPEWPDQRCPTRHQGRERRGRLRQHGSDRPCRPERRRGSTTPRRHWTSCTDSACV